jgi:signal transduction histidine kinase
LSVLTTFQPIRRRLPLLISLLLGVAVAAFTWLAYRQMVTVLRTTGEVRAVGATQGLASALAISAQRLRTESRRVADDSNIRRALAQPDSAIHRTVRAFFEQIVEGAPQVTALELFGTRGEPVVTAGRPEIGYPSIDSLRIDWDSITDQARIGPIRLDVQPVQYRVVTTVNDRAGGLLGYFVQHRALTSGQGLELLEGLIGSDASLLLGNADGGGWTNLEDEVPGPTVTADSGGAVLYTDVAGERRVGGVMPIGGTPWMAVVAEPENGILAPARDHLRAMIQLAVFVVAVGTLAAWLLSRQITGPLIKISDAADAIANGDLTRRAPQEREDELGSLAKSFNSMAEQVANSTHELEERVEQRTTELREAQGTLVRRERLAMLGQLAGSVGHELRNPLGVMTNAVYYLDAVLASSPDPVQEYLGILRTQIGLSEKIISDLLDYARVRPPQRQHVSVEQIVQDQRDRLVSYDGVHVVTDFPAGLPDVYVDRVQVGQIVLNLLTNAIQAMPEDGGTLTLRGRGVAEGWVVLDVEDTGSGIAPDSMEKVFEPLFTTKARGIGLGLAVSRGLAQANAGSLTLVSKIGRGTTFSLRLPIGPEAVD